MELQQEDPDRELVHAVRNLLAVIYTQAAVSRADPSPGAAARALSLIEKAAKSTERAIPAR